MDFRPLLDSVPPIPSHAIVAKMALVVGVIQLAGSKGTRAHRILGYIWAISILYVAISGLFIHEIGLWGRWSPIHLLSLLAIAGVPLAVRAARCGDIRKHRSIMLQLFGFALVLAGAFTLLPGRVMHRVLLAVQ